MRGRRINDKWMEKMLEEFEAYHKLNLAPAPQIFTWNVSCQWYIRKLVENGIPYRVIQRGAGVKEVVVEKKRCEHCKGKGYLYEWTNQKES